MFAFIKKGLKKLIKTVEPKIDAIIKNIQPICGIIPKSMPFFTELSLISVL